MSYHPKPHQSPAWSLKGYPIISDEPSRWEKFLIAENIEEKDLGSDPKVLKFITENAEKFYVPTAVLKMYGMDYDA